jgi:flagellar assembly protein FliH
LSEAPVSFALEPLEPSEPPPRDAAARLLAEAQREAGEIRERARSEGHAEGRAAGLADARAELTAAGEALEEALRGVGELRVQAAESVERDAIELALALAGKILAATLEARPELIVEVVQGALRRVSGQRPLSILLNPSDLETVRAALGDPQLRGAGAGESLDLQPDQRVAAGGAIVRTAEGEVDAQIQTQLERAREVALAELAGGQP